MSACDSSDDVNGFSQETMKDGQYYVKVDNSVYYLSEEKYNFPIPFGSKLNSSDNHMDYKGRTSSEAYVKAVEAMGWNLRKEDHSSSKNGVIHHAFEKDGHIISLYEYPDKGGFSVREE